MFFLEKIIAVRFSVLEIIQHPGRESDFASANIFAGGWTVVDSERTVKPKYLGQFLLQDAPDIVVRRTFQVLEADAGKAQFTLHAGGDYLRVYGMGNIDKVYGAILEEGDAKYVLGWTDASEWGDISRFNLAWRVAMKKNNRWQLLRRAVSMGGMSSPQQDALERTRRLGKAFHRDLGDEKGAFDFPVKSRTATDGMVKFRIDGLIIPLHGFGNIERVQLRLGEIHHPFLGHVKVAECYGYDVDDPARLIEPRINMYILGAQEGRIWRPYPRPILLDSRIPGQQRQMRSAMWELALTHDFDPGYLHGQWLGQRVSPRGFTFFVVNRRRVYIYLGSMIEGKRVFGVLWEREGKKMAMFWKDEDVWKGGGPPLRKVAAVLADRKEGDWVVRKTPEYVSEDLGE